MKFEILGSHLCAGTLYAINRCFDENLDFSFRNLSSSLSELKYFLSHYANDEIYKPYREMSSNPDYSTKGTIGIPCFIFEDGTSTMELSEAIAKAKQE